MAVSSFRRDRSGNLLFTERARSLRSEFFAPPRGGKGSPDPLLEQRALGLPPAEEGGRGLRPRSPLAPLPPSTGE